MGGGLSPPRGGMGRGSHLAPIPLEERHLRLFRAIQRGVRAIVTPAVAPCGHTSAKDRAVLGQRFITQAVSVASVHLTLNDFQQEEVRPRKVRIVPVIVTEVHDSVTRFATEVGKVVSGGEVEVTEGAHNVGNQTLTRRERWFTKFLCGCHSMMY